MSIEKEYKIEVTNKSKLLLIERSITAHYKCDADKIKKKGNNKLFMQIFIFLATETTNVTYQEIADYVGLSNHTMITYHKNRIIKVGTYDKDITDNLKILLQSVRNRMIVADNLNDIASNYDIVDLNNVVAVSWNSGFVLFANIEQEDIDKMMLITGLKKNKVLKFENTGLFLEKKRDEQK